MRIASLQLSPTAGVAPNRSLVFNAPGTPANRTLMFTKCPACGSLNVRRSWLRKKEATATPRLRSPYRCRDCGERFWIASRRANYLMGFAGIVIIAGALAWNAAGGPDKPRGGAAPNAASAQAFEETSARAARDDPTAEFRLSRMYARGDGVAPDKALARTWLERAAQHGNAEAQYELGNALREGIGTIQDYELAAKWLELAAARGNGNAQYALGQMYRAGMGVQIDNVKAYMWFNLAAAQDVAGAPAQRDALLRILSPAEVLEAQAEARRLIQPPGKRSAMAQ